MNGINIDFIGGSVADVLLNNNCDPNFLRPYKEDGGVFVTNAQSEKVQLQNANATLTKDQWQHLDRAVKEPARARLAFVNDLVSSGLTYDLPNAMGHNVLQYQSVSDTSNATISMDGLRESDKSRNQVDLTNLPIPIIHKDVEFSFREIAVMNNGNGTPLDTTQIAQASRKVAEAAEKLHLGNYTNETGQVIWQFGGGNIYGLRNHPSRITTTYSDWTASAKTGEQRLDDILGFLQTMRDNYQYGPYGIYLGSNLAQYLDEDYKANSDLTLRQRIVAVGDDGGEDNKIRFIRTLDYLSDDDIIVVSLDPGNPGIRTVQGMAPTLLQWDNKGGMNLHYKVMAIMVPRVQPDYNSKLGILHATKA